MPILERVLCARKIGQLSLTICKFRIQVRGWRLACVHTCEQYIIHLYQGIVTLISTISAIMTIFLSKEQTEHLNFIFDLMSKQDDSTYIGEQISQLAHSLQAAHLAAISGESENVTIAALLHDLGQILPLTEKNDIRTSQNQQQSSEILDEEGKSVGRIGHELIGEEYLRKNGWPEEVSALVGAHVMAKRYLAIQPEYFNSLSKASKSSLKGQGGPFTEKEAEYLRATDPILFKKIALRKFDDGAKVVGKHTRTLEQWYDVAYRVYSGQGRSSVNLLEVELRE